MRLAIGKKQVEQAGKWLLSASTFGGAAGLGLLYFTDWKIICKYIPFYGGKFPAEEPEK